MTYQMLVVHRGYHGERLNEFVGRGRRGDYSGGLRYGGYLKYLRSPGGWELGFNSDDERVITIRPYHTVEFWLKDTWGGAKYEAFLASLPSYMLSSARRGWYRDFTGLVLTEPRVKQTSDGVFTTNVRGRGMNELLYSEYIDYAPDTPQAYKSGVTETVIKQYVNENIGPGAGLDVGGQSRVRSMLSIEADQFRGGTWAGSRSRKLLGTVIESIADAEDGPCDYMIVQTGDMAYEFQLRAPHWGLDRRIGNAQENDAMIFAPRLGNVESLLSSMDYLQSNSGVIAYGQGDASQLKPGTAYDTTFTTITSFARKVGVRYKRNIADQDDLDTAAYEELRQTRPLVDVEISTKMVPSCRYNVHWQVGDLVTIEETQLNRRIARKIKGVNVQLKEAGQESGGTVKVTPEFGDFIDV